MSNQITFSSRTQGAIFQNEIKGQISDGMWENSPGTDWETWCDTEVLVGANTGRRGYVRKAGFALERLAKHDVVAARMISYARLAIAFPHSDWDDLYRLENCRTRSIYEWSAKSEYWTGICDRFARIARDHGVVVGDEPRMVEAGQNIVAELMEKVAYGEAELAADLRAIKATMKKRWEPVENQLQAALDRADAAEARAEKAEAELAALKATLSSALAQ